MIVLEPRTRERCRKILISAFILFHFSVLSLWILPPFSAMMAESAQFGGIAGQLEKRVFNALKIPDRGFLSALTQHYINLIGAHQYWDFFAPESPRIHRYLSVCSNIREYAESSRIDCVEPSYRSFEGDPEDAVRFHDGNGSRSFRLVENLVRLHRPDLLDAFTIYWQKENKTEVGGSSFVLLHEFTLHPESLNPATANERLDKVFWIAPD